MGMMGGMGHEIQLMPLEIPTNLQPIMQPSTLEPPQRQLPVCAPAPLHIEPGAEQTHAEHDGERTVVTNRLKHAREEDDDDDSPRGGKKPYIAWHPDEDAKVVELVAVYGAKNWPAIALHLPGRVGKQCRERCAPCTAAPL
jgi:hypothetical protein